MTEQGGALPQQVAAPGVLRAAAQVAGADHRVEVRRIDQVVDTPRRRPEGQKQGQKQQQGGEGGAEHTPPCSPAGRDGKRRAGPRGPTAAPPEGAQPEKAGRVPQQDQQQTGQEQQVGKGEEDPPPVDGAGGGEEAQEEVEGQHKGEMEKVPLGLPEDRLPIDLEIQGGVCLEGGGAGAGRGGENTEAGGLGAELPASVGAEAEIAGILLPGAVGGAQLHAVGEVPALCPAEAGQSAVEPPQRPTRAGHTVELGLHGLRVGGQVPKKAEFTMFHLTTPPIPGRISRTAGGGAHPRGGPPHSSGLRRVSGADLFHVAPMRPRRPAARAPRPRPGAGGGAALPPGPCGPPRSGGSISGCPARRRVG